MVHLAKKMQVVWVSIPFHIQILNESLSLRKRLCSRPNCSDLQPIPTPIGNHCSSCSTMCPPGSVCSFPSIACKSQLASFHRSLFCRLDLDHMRCRQIAACVHVMIHTKQMRVLEMLLGTINYEPYGPSCCNLEGLDLMNVMLTIRPRSSG